MLNLSNRITGGKREALKVEVRSSPEFRYVGRFATPGWGLRMLLVQARSWQQRVGGLEHCYYSSTTWTKKHCYSLSIRIIATENAGCGQGARTPVEVLKMGEVLKSTEGMNGRTRKRFEIAS